MAVPAPETFADLLSALDRDAFVSFVADVWRARGWSVTRDGDVLIVSDDDETRRLLPVVHRWLRGVAPSLDRDDGVETVVDRDGRAAEAVADRGVGYVGPSDLRSSILYEIDRDDADRLFGEYFDRPVDDGEPARPPTRAAVESDETAGDSGVNRWNVDSAVLLERGSVLVLVLLLVVASATALGVDPFSPSGTFGGGSSSVDYNVSGGNASGNISVGAVSRSRPYPPGVSKDHVNGSALAEAHVAALGDSSYKLRAVQSIDSRPGGGTKSRENGTKPRRITHIESTNWATNRTRFTGSMNETVETAGNVSLRQIVTYGTGNEVISGRRSNRSNETEYRKYPEGPNSTPVRTPVVFLREFLGDTNATVTPTQRGHRRYRIVVRNPPDGIAKNITHYRAVAIVNGSGFVSRFELNYTAVYNSGMRKTVRRQNFTYRFYDVGTTQFSAPQWPSWPRHWYKDARRRLDNSSNRDNVTVRNRTTT